LRSEALDAIDRTGTFAEAAVLLHRVPSALTYLVQKKSELGVTLFDRSGARS
jgi:DNA-binding transcriptional LysR family regulator